MYTIGIVPEQTETIVIPMIYICYRLLAYDCLLSLSSTWLLSTLTIKPKQLVLDISRPLTRALHVVHGREDPRGYEYTHDDTEDDASPEKRVLGLALVFVFVIPFHYEDELDHCFGNVGGQVICDWGFYRECDCYRSRG
jgi:hypothetical protein